MNQNLYLFILIFLLSETPAFAVDFYYQNCSVPTTCGRLNISYPFYIPGRQQDFCGYPGFQLSCHGGADDDEEEAYPLLQLSGDDYIIHNISYERQTLVVSNARLSHYLDNSSCANLSLIHNLTLPNEQFELAPKQDQFFLLHNCSPSFVDSFPTYKIGCSNTSVLALPRQIYPKFEGLVKVEKCGSSEVAVAQGGGYGNDEAAGMKEVLGRGFEMKWLAGDCSDCQRSGGLCGFNYTTHLFRCLCPNRSYSVFCRGGEARNFRMGPVALFILAILAHRVVLHSAEDSEAEPSKRCPGHFCNDVVGNIRFPFKSPGDPRECGLFTVNCSEPNRPKIQLKEEGYQYEFNGSLAETWHEFKGSFAKSTWIFINDGDLADRLQKDHCDDGVFNDLRLPITSPIPEVSLFTLNLTLIKCDIFDKNYYPQPKDGCRNAYHTYINSSNSNLTNPPPPRARCTTIQVPMLHPQPDMYSSLTAEFHLYVSAPNCTRCRESKGVCLVPEGKFECAKEDKQLKLKLGLGIGLGFPALLAICGFLLLLYKQKRSSLFLSRNISSQPYTNSDIEGGGAYCGIPVFSYRELDEATNHFDSESELGDGGFGTVYYGKLKDGREVAVKRLYEHNYKRVEQFINEIEILTRLRHRNLVSLYGCTSRRSRELLLVYEYISNGTVSDHLHGDRADGSLTWPIRMSIAIETADALSYLHASEIVHRDVKTNNILLDDNFCVKVADFGLSRLFPFNVTHVSTAPQGTPGYVDPEYHECYQLTSKSDVYSFGVVLIELISSLPAVDIMRHRHEINLANLAISKIQKGLFNELADQRLGFESDGEVRRMIIAVAELAFQCLQQDNNVRPTMNEVLEALKMIESGSYVPENLKPELDSESVKTSVQPPASPASPDSDEIGLLNVRPPPSPVSVTQKWPSTRSTSPNASA